MKETKNCPFCNEEILFEAKKCKHCKELLVKFNTNTELKYKTIEEVPWYRTKFSAWLMFFVFPLALMPVVITGDIYYVKKGELKAVGMFGRVFGGFIALGILIKVSQAIFIMLKETT